MLGWFADCCPQECWDGKCLGTRKNLFMVPAKIFQSIDLVLVGLIVPFPRRLLTLPLLTPRHALSGVPDTDVVPISVTSAIYRLPNDSNLELFGILSCEAWCLDRGSSPPKHKSRSEEVNLESGDDRFDSGFSSDCASYGTRSASFYSALSSLPVMKTNHFFRTWLLPERQHIVLCRRRTWKLHLALTSA